jgi:Na+/proline symporter
MIVGWTMFAVGMGLVCFFDYNPLPADELALIREQPDRIMPYYILHHVPPGISGLIIATLFAAGISTLDSALSALGQTTISDLYKKFIGKDKSEKHYIFVFKCSILLWCLILAGFAIILIDYQASGLLRLGLQAPGYIYGAILGIALLAYKRVGSFSSILPGTFLAIACVLLCQKYKIAFFWWYPVGTIVLILTACAIEFLKRNLKTNGRS